MEIHLQLNLLLGELNFGKNDFDSIILCYNYAVNVTFLADCQQSPMP